MLPALALSFCLWEEPTLRIAILPLGQVESPQIQAVREGLSRQFKVETVALKARPLPSEAYYQSRNRYRADRILAYLDVKARGFDRVIAITQRDISTTYRDHYDWGIVGLGRLGGYSCVVSTFRLKKPGTLTPQERLRRSATHEIGHTFGLDHCPSPGCVMKDYGGKLKLMDQAGPVLCRSCRNLVRPGSVVR